MSSHFDLNKPIDHKAIFPPRSNRADRIESISNSPIANKGAIAPAQDRVEKSFPGDEEEPERWDGMS